MAMYNRLQDLHIFGPEALRPIIRFYLSYFADGNNYKIEFHEVNARSLTPIWESKNVKVSAFPLKHRIDCFGYRFDEVCTERMLEKRPAASYAYCSDTMPFPELALYLKGVRTIYHEATYTKELADKAPKYFHSTTVDAAQCALEAGAKMLLVGHYSSRVKDREIFELECKEIFANSRAVDDGDIIEID